jgi:hypothetical protein
LRLIFISSSRTKRPDFPPSYLWLLFSRISRLGLHEERSSSPSPLRLLGSRKEGCRGLPYSALHVRLRRPLRASKQISNVAGMIRSAAGRGRPGRAELSSFATVARIADRSLAFSPTVPPYSLLGSSGTSRPSLRCSKTSRARRSTSEADLPLRFPPRDFLVSPPASRTLRLPGSGQPFSSWLSGRRWSTRSIGQSPAPFLPWSSSSWLICSEPHADLPLTRSSSLPLF